MKRFSAPEIVALMLAVCVVIFFVVGLILPAILKFFNPEFADAAGDGHIHELWTDIIQTLLGGLIGYIAGTTGTTKIITSNDEEKEKDDDN